MLKQMDEVLTELGYDKAGFLDLADSKLKLKLNFKIK